MNHFANAMSSYISDSLPFGDRHVKFAIGMGISSSLDKLIFYMGTKWKFLEYFQKKRNKLVIFDKDNEDIPNPIYFQLQKYIIEKHKNSIKECDLDTSEGKYTYNLRNSVLNNIEDNYLDIKY